MSLRLLERWRRPTKRRPSERFRKLVGLYRDMHDAGLPDLGIPPEHLFIGGSLLPHVETIRSLVRRTGAKTVLDYGAGKATLYGLRNLALPNGLQIETIQSYWNVDRVAFYDPAVTTHDILPFEKFDGLISTDALEHCPESDMNWIVEEMFSSARLFVFANVASYPAAKRLPTGENAHATIRPFGWWEALFKKHSQRRRVPFRLEVVERPSHNSVEDCRVSVLSTL